MDAIIPMLPLFLKGLLVTIEVSVEAILLGLVMGTLLAIARLSKWHLVRAPINIYISYIRGTPLLIQIFVIFYALPEFGLDVPAYWAGVIALSLNSAAFVAEIIRGGMNVIPRGQIEAAYALGMPYYMTLRRVVFPQIFAVILPQLTNEFITIIKASPILSVITVVELTRVGQQIISRTYQPVGTYILIAALYLALNTVVALITHYLERKAALTR